MLYVLSIGVAWLVARRAPGAVAAPGTAAPEA
jgi:hypothetical protein